jgi:hypothetical protein
MPVGYIDSIEGFEKPYGKVTKLQIGKSYFLEELMDAGYYKLIGSVVPEGLIFNPSYGGWIVKKDNQIHKYIVIKRYC